MPSVLRTVLHHDNTEYRIKPSLYCEGAENLVFEVEKKVEEEDICFVFTPVTISS